MAPPNHLMYLYGQASNCAPQTKALQRGALWKLRGETQQTMYGELG